MQFGWFCPDSRFGRIVPLELVMIIAGGDAHSVVKPSPVRGFWGQAMLWVSSSAVSASSRSPARPLLYRQWRVVVTRAWCGPGGYIQVGKRG
jgi:hypothetical protein